jgi:hypothetical protein
MHHHEPASAVRSRHGPFGWVELSDGEYRRLTESYGESVAMAYIDMVDEKAELTGNKNAWRNWYLTVCIAIRDEWTRSYGKGSAVDMSNRAKSGRTYSQGLFAQRDYSDDYYDQFVTSSFAMG